MTCYHPIKAYRSKSLTASGKRQLVFVEKESNGDTLEISCGQCRGCRLDRSRVWAVRISNEASLYNENCFITLTYAPEHLPPGGSLVVSDYQKFMKRLRKFYGKQGKKIRFFQCGEYGERFSRPHYHACLLNFDFPDKVLYRRSERGDNIYRSASLESLWPFGRSEIGAVTFESAAYVARYIMKKVTGPLAADHYCGRQPEYTTMSRRPGIGAPWFERFSSDVYNHDVLVIRGGIKVPPPRFYNNQYEVMNPEHYEKIKRKRFLKQIDQLSSGEFSRKSRDNTYERRKVKEAVHAATVNATLNRILEKE